jgi:Zn-dependent M28 family amino/carboxypeptidase
MFRAQAFLIALLPTLASAAGFSGPSALEFTRRAVGFGPRPSGSPANHQLQAYILTQLKACKCQVAEDPFTPQTPKGPIAMKNIVAKFPGKSGKAVVITGHYDTKLFPGRKFVGASDGGSSTGLLLELARVLAGQTRTDDVYLVWLDGEEAVRTEWAGEDNLYGSRHLAARWSKDGTAAKIKGLINVDMIGDAHLNLKQEQNSNARLRQLVWRSASDLGYKAYFRDQDITIEDDHIPFLKVGIPALDLIDFDYDPWHTDQDTMDKLSAQSLEIVGTVVLDVIQRLERQ